MFVYRWVLLSGLIFGVMLLAGCSFASPTPPAKQASATLAPLISEPGWSRFHSGPGPVRLVPISDPSLPHEEIKPEPGFTFLLVSFPLADEQTFAVDDYELQSADGKTSDVPLGAAGQNETVAEFFYDTIDFADTVKITRAEAETNTLNSATGDEPLLVAWGTPSTTLVLLYEVPVASKSFVFRHGDRTFPIIPTAGLTK